MLRRRQKTVCEKDILVDGVPVKLTKKSNMKNWYLRIVPPDGTVKVSVPARVSDASVLEFIRSKMAFILKSRQEILSRTGMQPMEYASGEIHYLWGEPYKLQIITSDGVASIERRLGELLLSVPKGSAKEYIEKAMMEWYRLEMKRVLPEIVHRCEDRIGIRVKEYRIKNMRTRWGSCRISEGRIWLNLHLVKKPLACLEYVVTHEIVHLLEKHHNKRFYSLVEKYYPQWQEAEKLLKS